jgi:hypothetical protein
MHSTRLHVRLEMLPSCQSFPPIFSGLGGSSILPSPWIYIPRQCTECEQYQISVLVLPLYHLETPTPGEMQMTSPGTVFPYRPSAFAFWSSAGSDAPGPW